MDKNISFSADEVKNFNSSEARHEIAATANESQLETALCSEAQTSQPEASAASNTVERQQKDNKMETNHLPVEETKPYVAPESPTTPTESVPAQSTDEQVVTPEDAKQSASTAAPAAIKGKKPAPEKDFTPVYDGDEKVRLEALTKLCEAEIRRVMSDPAYGAVKFGDDNCIIDLRKAAYGNLYTPEVNRIHGKDMTTTGESLLTHGPQHPLLVITVKMARKAGLVPVRFSTDPLKDKPVDEAGLVVIDGNGRVGYLITLPVEKWPAVYAIFPTKDAAGMFNLNKSFDVINSQVTVWKTQDMVQKRLLTDGDAAHAGWKMINSLLQKGYRYQAACELTTLGTDRIKKSAVIGQDSKEVFAHYSCAVKIFNPLCKMFGDTDALKTKEFPRKVSLLWGELQKKGGDEDATKRFLAFLSSLSEDKIKQIKEAKSVKGGASKDEQRKTLLEDAFRQYVETKGIEL